MYHPIPFRTRLVKLLSAPRTAISGRRGESQGITPATTNQSTEVSHFQINQLKFPTRINRLTSHILES